MAFSTFSSIQSSFSKLYTKVLAPDITQYFNASATISVLTDICFDNNNNMYVCSYSANAVYAIRNNTLTLLASSISSPNGICFYNGFLFVSCFNGNAIIKINATTGASSTLCTLTNPAGICVDETGTLYCLSRSSALLFSITQSGTVSEYSTNTNSVSGTNFRGITITPTTFYLFDRNGNIYTIQRTQGSNLTLWSSNIGFTCWKGILDSTGNFLYVSNNANSVNYVYKINLSNALKSVYYSGTARTSSGIIMLGTTLYVAEQSGVIYQLTNS